MTTIKELRRALRDLAVILAGVALGILSYRNHGAGIIAAIVLGSILLIGLTSALVAHYSGARHPVAMVRAMEYQVWALHVPGTIVAFGALAFAGGALASHFSDPSDKYWFGLVPGLIVGALSAGLILPAKNESWTEKYISAHYPKRFKALFGEGANPSLPIWAKQKWPNISRQKAAMVDSHYESEDGKWYWGWGHKARLARAKTMRASLSEILA